jgi:hypothetical protein
VRGSLGATPPNGFCYGSLRAGKAILVRQIAQRISNEHRDQERVDEFLQFGIDLRR